MEMEDILVERENIIVKTSIIGIAVNLILVAFKATIGIMVNSIAITLDAVNNLTDALSSIITIIGAKLAGRRPNKEHPYGYGRIEYLSSVIIAAIVLWAGITALIESAPKILYPDVTSYTTVSLIIIAVAVVVKLALGRYVKSKGEEIDSQALVASGSDALFDSILSLSTLAGALISVFFHISIEGILGVIISFVIIKASLEMLKETVDSMIGVRIDDELSKEIKEIACEFPGVYSAHDLILHNYGPEKVEGSLHITIDDNLNSLQIHRLTRDISVEIFKRKKIIVTVGIYARHDNYLELREDLESIAEKYEEIVEIHGLLVYEDLDKVSFDIIVDFDYDRDEVKEKVLDEIKSKHSQFEYEIIDDYDISD